MSNPQVNTNTGRVTVIAVTLPDYSLEKTAAVVHEFETLFKAIPDATVEVRHVSRPGPDAPAGLDLTKPSGVVPTA